MTEHPILSATITEVASQENGYSWTVKADNGLKLYLRGMGAPKGNLEIGSRGTIQYQSTPRFGLYFWKSAE